MTRLAQALGVALCLVTACSAQAFPDYGEPTFSGLSVNGVDGGPDGTVCDWLNLVAFRGFFRSLEDTRTFVLERLDTLTYDHLQHVRLSPTLLDKIKANMIDSECGFAPKETEFRPWNHAIDGNSAPQNHKILVDTTGGSVDASTGAFTPGDKGVFIANVHADAPGAESMHHHQALSIFIHYGAPTCQIGIDVDGSYEPGPYTCEQDVTVDTPKSLEILFTGSQWLHANWLLAPMALPNARNCPADLAPEHFGERGFMMRIFFPMNETNVYYPPNPNGTKIDTGIVV